MAAPKIRAFPVPAAKKTTLKHSFDRVYIPGTNPPRKYQRGRHSAPADIPAAKGSKIVAPWDGVARLKSFGKAFGKQVTIVANGTTWGFFAAHCERILVKEGQRVKANQQIATVDTTGQTSGSHLHPEFREKWNDWKTARDLYRELIRAQHAPQ